MWRAQQPHDQLLHPKQQVPNNPMSTQNPTATANAKQGVNYAERQLLGALLIDPIKVSEVADLVRPEHLSTERGRILYELLLELSGRGEMFDISVVASELKGRNQADLVGGIPALVELTQGVTTSQHALYHAGTVKAAGVKRQVSALLAEAQKIALELEPKPEVVDRWMADLQGSLVRLDGYTNPDEVVRSWMDTHDLVGEMFTPQPKNQGIRTGWPDLDGLISGLTAGQLIVVGARPRVGKTALAASLLAQIAPQNPDHTYLFFSLEMTCKEIMQRLICARSKINLHEIRQRGVRPGEDAAIQKAADELRASSIVIRDSAGITMPQIMQYCRQTQYKFGLDMVVVDYAQLIRGDAKKPRYEVVTEISRGLKELAKKLHVPVLALAQLNRNAEDPEGLPGLQDLRESGSLEQDADQVWLLHRPEIFDPTPENKGQAKLIVAKQRNGPTDIVRLRYLAESMCFVNSSPQASAPIHE